MLFSSNIILCVEWVKKNLANPGKLLELDQYFDVLNDVYFEHIARPVINCLERVAVSDLKQFYRFDVVDKKKKCKFSFPKDSPICRIIDSGNDSHLLFDCPCLPRKVISVGIVCDFNCELFRKT